MLVPPKFGLLLKAAASCGQKPSLKHHGLEAIFLISLSQTEYIIQYVGVTCKRGAGKVSFDNAEAPQKNRERFVPGGPPLNQRQTAEYKTWKKIAFSWNPAGLQKENRWKTARNSQTYRLAGVESAWRFNGN